MCCVGLYQIYGVYHAEFKKYLKRGVLGDGEQRCIEHGGRFGVAARGRSSLSDALWSPPPQPHHQPTTMCRA
jgi:hypothetical protein